MRLQLNLYWVDWKQTILAEIHYTSQLVTGVSLADMEMDIVWNTVESNWAMSWENMFSGVSDQVRLKPACSASMKLEILVTETRDITLSRQRTTKALIRLRRCAGWSVPLLFAYDIRHVFSWPSSIESTVYNQCYSIFHKTYSNCFPNHQKSRIKNNNKKTKKKFFSLYQVSINHTDTVILLSFRTDRSGQTVQTQIRLLL